MNLLFTLATVFCLSLLGAAAPTGEKTKETREKHNSLRFFSTKNSTEGNLLLSRKESETTTFGRRIRSIVARRRTTSKAQEVALKDSAVRYIEENHADLTEFESKDFQKLYQQLGYK